MGKRGFGELELSILKIIQEIGRATVRDVHNRLGSGSYTTIMTVMGRMAEKGDLQREKEGKQYIYWQGSPSTSSSKSVLKRIKDKIFGGKGVAMVGYLLEIDPDLSEKDLEALEQMIQKRKESKKNG